LSVKKLLNESSESTFAIVQVAIKVKHIQPIEHQYSRTLAGFC